LNDTEDAIKPETNAQALLVRLKVKVGDAGTDCSLHEFLDHMHRVRRGGAQGAGAFFIAIQASVQLTGKWVYELARGKGRCCGHSGFPSLQNVLRMSCCGASVGEPALHCVKDSRGGRYTFKAVGV